MIKKLLLVSLITLSSPAQAWSLFGPIDYDDRVLAGIKDTQTTPSVYAVKQLTMFEKVTHQVVSYLTALMDTVINAILFIPDSVLLSFAGILLLYLIANRMVK